jgi:hypothetical protein
MSSKIDDVVKAIVDLQKHLVSMSNEEKILAGELAGSALRRGCVLTRFTLTNFDDFQQCTVEAGPLKLQITGDPDLTPIPF